MSYVSQNEIYETVCDDLFSYPCKIASLVDLRGKVTFWMSTYVSLLYGVSAVFQNFRVLWIRKNCKTKLQNKKCKIYPNFAFCCKIKLQNYLHRMHPICCIFRWCGSAIDSLFFSDIVLCVCWSCFANRYQWCLKLIWDSIVYMQ